MFGIERTLDLVRAARNQTSPEIVKSLYADVRDFAAGAAQENDITATIINRPSHEIGGVVWPP